MPLIHEEYIFIVLEEDQIFISTDTTEIPDIELGDIRSSLKSEYASLNKNPAETIIQYSLSLGTSDYLIKSKLSLSIDQKKINYVAPDDLAEAAMNIIKKIQRTIQDFILMILPEKPKRLDLTNVFPNIIDWILNLTRHLYRKLIQKRYLHSLKRPTVKKTSS